MYGETWALAIVDLLAMGLSPRVRGNQAKVKTLDDRQGSIPACTGKPSACTGRDCTRGVYPRVYGETIDKSSNTQALPGLSPRVRGNPRQVADVCVYLWSIPACTGKPSACTGRDCTRGVYPRVYGETIDKSSNTQALPGLSPRVRGNPRQVADVCVYLWSIPACTGKPSVAGLWWSPLQGLSPRVRGNLLRNIDPARPYGSIPACTGKPGRPYSRAP